MLRICGNGLLASAHRRAREELSQTVVVPFEIGKGAELVGNAVEIGSGIDIVSDVEADSSPDVEDDADEVSVAVDDAEDVEVLDVIEGIEVVEAGLFVVDVGVDEEVRTTGLPVAGPKQQADESCTTCEAIQVENTGQLVAKKVCVFAIITADSNA